MAAVARRLGRLARGLHRQLGLALCGLFAVWFLSGVVMTFSDFPSVTATERRARSLPLSGAGPLPAPDSLGTFGQPGTSLRMLGNRPAYFLDGEPSRTRWADDGAPLAGISKQMACDVAGDGAWIASTLREVDTWTSWYTGPLPLYLLRLDDGQGTESYVAAATGVELQRSTRRERVLAWLGAIPHWLYFRDLRRQRELWRWTIIALSALGCAVCVTGLFRGVSILRRTRGGALPRSPAKDRELRFHHLLGLAFGVLAFTWTFSGMLSLSPFPWNQRGDPTARHTAAFAGDAGPLAAFSLPPHRAVAACDRHLVTREIRLTRVLGRSYYVCLGSVGGSRLVPASDARARVLRTLPSETLRRAAEAVLGGAVEREALESQGDDYYYATHRSGPLRLPFFRAQRGDLRVYVDPLRGELLKVSTPESRWTRWLYHGLHSWDVARLHRHRTLWRTLVVAAMLTGLVLSVSAIRLSARLIGRRGARRARATGPRHDLPAAVPPGAPQPRDVHTQPRQSARIEMTSGRAAGPPRRAGRRGHFRRRAQ